MSSTVGEPVPATPLLGLAGFGVLLEAMPDALIGVDRAGVIRFVNDRAAALFGYDRDVLVGELVEALVPESFRMAHQAQRQGYAAAPRTRPMNSESQFFGVRRDGTEFPVDISLSHVQTGDGLLVIAAVRDMTARNEAEEDRRRSDMVLAAMQFSGDAIIIATLDGIITSWNHSAETLFGYTSAEIVGQSARVLTPKDRAHEVGDAFAKIISGQPVVMLETIRVRKDRTVFAAAITMSAAFGPDGALVGASTIARDVSEQREKFAASERMAAIIEHSDDAIIGKTLDGVVTSWNPAAQRMYGYTSAEMIGKHIALLSPDDDGQEITAILAKIRAGQHVERLYTVRVRKDGTTLTVSLTVSPIHDPDGTVVGASAITRDITAEREAQEALAHQAIHDPLTGLHNRAWILDILQADLRAAKRAGTSVAALFVDLDNFKVVNDSLGHAAGDEVLTTVANRISTVLRPEDRVGRFGGDEFVIVLQNVADVAQVERFAERVSAAIAADLQVHGHRIVPNASIGIALSTAASTPESLLRDTDSAMFRAKAAGRARWQFFDDAMHAQAVARLTVEDELRDAITRKEFVVHYQPIVALADSHVVGHEALVRWAHPTRGLLSPGEFLDVAEDSGLITAIGAQVLDQACMLLAARPDLPGPISVNVSAVQLAATDWLGAVTDALAAHRVDPARLVIEITETAALSMTDSALHALESLCGLGVGIHLDDFGTGYSSISVLRDLPVTGVKLDLSFVRDLTSGKSQANALAHGLSGLVNGMQLTGIAEGIETQMQAHILHAQGWELGQGYYFGRPAAMPISGQTTDDDPIA